MKSIATLASVVLLGWVGGCSEPRAELQEHRLLAMGTWVDVVWEGPEIVKVLRVSNRGEVQITSAMAERFTAVAGISPDVIMRQGL